MEKEITTEKTVEFPDEIIGREALLEASKVFDGLDKQRILLLSQSRPYEEAALIVNYLF